MYNNLQVLLTYITCILCLEFKLSINEIIISVDGVEAIARKMLADIKVFVKGKSC